MGIFNHYLRLMQENGATQQIAQYYKPKPQQCGDTTGTPLGFNNTAAAFVVTLSGMVLALLLFAIEILTHKCGMKLWILECYGKKNNLVAQSMDKNNSNSNSERPYACGLCGKTFGNLEGLGEHVNKMHIPTI